MQQGGAMRQAARSAIRSEGMARGDDGAARARERQERGPRRLFADEEGVLWTAEVRRPRFSGPDGEPGAPLILFWSDTRACLATLRRAQPIAELTEDELRGHLRACLTG